MVKRQVNSFGTFTIPKDMRDELGIIGTAMLRLEVRECNNRKEIVIRKDDDLNEVFEKYKKTAEIISRISECTVATIWNNDLMSLSMSRNTESFIGKLYVVDITLQNVLKSATEPYVILQNSVNFLPNNKGEVIAYYKIPNTGDDNGFFLILKGTKQDIQNNISKAELQRRLEIVSDIVEMGN